MNGRVFIVILLLSVARGWADTDAGPTESGDTRTESTSDQEWETKGVIPQGGLAISTQPITPIALVPDRDPYQQGLQELALAQDLFKKGNMEAASDIGLESYDDLVSVHMPRRTKGNKNKRQKLRDDRHTAATLYTDSSIAYIQGYVNKNGSSKRAIEEGRARLGDLRDVTQNYPELTKKLSKALETYNVSPAVAMAIATSTATSVALSTAPVLSTSTAPAVSTPTAKPKS